MSIRFGRMVGVAWLILVISTFACGLLFVVLGEWRRLASTTEWTSRNTLAYVEHGRTYYSPPAVAMWHDRVSTVYVSLMIAIVPVSIIAGIIVHLSDAPGRPWKRRQGQPSKGK